MTLVSLGKKIRLLKKSHLKSQNGAGVHGQMQIYHLLMKEYSRDMKKFLHEKIHIMVQLVFAGVKVIIQFSISWQGSAG